MLVAWVRAKKPWSSIYKSNPLSRCSCVFDQVSYPKRCPYDSAEAVSISARRYIVHLMVDFRPTLSHH